MESALRSGSIDAAAAIEPFVTHSADSGDMRIIDRHYLKVGGAAVSTYFTTEEWARQNPATLDHFVRATRRATEFIDTNESAVRTIVQKYTGIEQATATRMTLPKFLPEFRRVNFEFWMHHMLAEQYLTRPIDISALVPFDRN